MIDGDSHESLTSRPSWRRSIFRMRQQWQRHRRILRNQRVRIQCLAQKLQKYVAFLSGLAAGAAP